MILYHLAGRDEADSIDAAGFTDGAATYKATGLDIQGVFFSEGLLDSNEDDPGSGVFAIELEPSAIERYEILEATSDHRKYALPAELANTAARKRLSSAEARAVPAVDRMTDPAYPFVND